jgi:hypothetical protein
MIAAVKRHWAELREGESGHRFQAHYERSRQRVPTGGLLHWVRLFSGTILFMIGFILLFMPGPGLPFIILGEACLPPSPFVWLRFSTPANCPCSKRKRRFAPPADVFAVGRKFNQHRIAARRGAKISFHENRSGRARVSRALGIECGQRSFPRRLASLRR